MDTEVLVGIDTNVFLDSLDILKELGRHMNAINMCMFVPCTVIRELDSLKGSALTARRAIEYIESEVKRKINSQIKVEASVVQKGETNDDTIALACKRNNAHVIITNDTALRIKVSSFGMTALSSIGKSANTLFQEIKDTMKEIDFMECEFQEDPLTPLQEINAQVACIIYTERVLPILSKEIGQEMVSVYLPQSLSKSLEDLVAYIIKNYGMFRSSFPKSALQMLKKMPKRNIDVKDMEKLLFIMGLSIPKWLRDIQEEKEF